MYRLEYLPSAVIDILEIEDYLFEHNPDAADKFTKAIEEQVASLVKYPLMYQAYEDNSYFRSMPLIYTYRLFYHVDDAAKTVKVHRVLHGMRDLNNMLE